MLKNIKSFLEKNRAIRSMAIFLYRNTYMRYWRYKENKNFLKNGEKVLIQANMALKEIGVDYWIDFGTLLGAVRHEDFLPHDEDLDFAMWKEDYSPKYQKVFEKYGFKKIKEFILDRDGYIAEESYELLGVQVDIFYYSKINNQLGSYFVFKPLEGFSREYTIKKISGLVPEKVTVAIEGVSYAKIKGKKYPAPSPIERHLSDMYGEDYIIEKKDWEPPKNTNNREILNNKIGKLRKYE